MTLCELNIIDITKNQSERRKNCRTQSATSTIFKMAATEQELTVAEQEILTARIDEEGLAEAVRCYPILYDKSMKEFKDQKTCLLLHFSPTKGDYDKAMMSLRRWCEPGLCQP